MNIQQFFSIPVHRSDLSYSSHVFSHNQHHTIQEKRMQPIYNEHFENSFLELQRMRWYSSRTELVCHSKNIIYSNRDILTMLSGGVRFHSCGRIKIDYGTREGIQFCIIVFIHLLVIHRTIVVRSTWR